MPTTYESCSHSSACSERADERTRRSRLRKWDRMSRRGVDSFLKSRPDDFWRRVQHGIPPEHRWSVWKSSLLSANCVAYSREAQEREQALFSDSPTASSCRASLLNQESTWNERIQLDVSRTFAELASFTEEHDDSLCRILNAYAFLNPEVGYVDGMSFVAGTLLLTSECSENETLLVFTRLLEDCGLKGLYRGGCPLLKQYEGIFDELMEELLPELRYHFANEGVKTGDYVRLWFLSLFAFSLPLETVLLVWDVIMCKGLPYLVLAALALLSSVQEVLLAKGHEEILQFFMSMKEAEDEMTAAEVGRCLSHRIWRFSKMPCVQRLFGTRSEQLSESYQTAETKDKRSFVLDHETALAKSDTANSKKDKRVSFSVDSHMESSIVNWYMQ